MEHLNALGAGTRLEEYEIRTVLGQGGFGITYLAFDTLLNIDVALKEYLPRDFAIRTAGSTVVPTSPADESDYRWGLDRFLDEARTLARFDHPHLNKVRRFFEANGTAYLALEYIDGQTLSALLGKYPTVPDAHLRRVVVEVLSGLEQVHAAGYVHRDIKPSNIMLRGDGSAVLLDFGAARQAVGQRSKSVTSILTPGYAPVEQYDTKAVDVGPWSDLYALGMVAYRCVSGLGDADLPDAVTRTRSQRRGSQDMTPPVEMGKGVYDAQFLEAIDWAIQVNEEERPQSIAEWREAFSDGPGAGAVQPRSSTTSPGPTPTTTLLEQATATNAARFSLLSKLALTVVGVAVLGTGLWMVGILPSGIEPTVGTEQEPLSDQSARPAALTRPAVSTPTVQDNPQTCDGQAQWARAQALGTSAAYREFIGRCPGHPMTELAKERLARPEEAPDPAGAQTDLPGDVAAEWERVKTLDTPAAYREFIGRYTGHPMAALAQERLAGLD